VVVLVNYTYEPVDDLEVTVRTERTPKTARSVERGEVALEATDDGARLHLPLDWTDLVVLQY